MTLAAVGEIEIDARVDPSATFSLISPAVADRLGVVRLPRKQPITLADGRRLKVDGGSMIVQVGDRSAPATVLILECPEPLLGALTLQALGLAVDPSTGTLRPTRSRTVRLGGVR